MAKLDAAPRLDGAITFCCPACTEAVRLDVADGIVTCPECNWHGSGEPWEIAAAGAAMIKQPVAKDGLPEIVVSSTLVGQTVELPEEIIVGMLHSGAKMVLGGGSKSFKTWCLADLALSIATGRHWWGREVRQGRVVYLNLEVQAAFFHQRMQSIAHAKGCSLPADLWIWNLRGHCCDHRQLLPELCKRLAGEQVRAIILDPTYKIMTGSENAQEEVAALMDSIERLALATGAAVIFGSHFAKGNAAGKEAIDRISGSGVFARDPDAILTMTRHEEDGCFVIDPILRNCPPIEPFGVRWDFPLMMNAPEIDPKQLKKPWTGKEKKPIPNPRSVAAEIEKNGGQVESGINAAGGLVQRVRVAFGVTKADAQTAIEAALQGGEIESVMAPNSTPQGGGKPKRVYVIRSGRKMGDS